jgi:hypothetical protein
MGVADDPPISDDVNLYRRITPQWLFRVPDAACVRASSGAFQTEALSVVVGDTLESFGLAPEDVVRGWPDNALVVFAARDARAVGLTVVRSPEGPSELDQAHGLVFGRKTTSRKRALHEASTWVVAPADACETPAG